MRLSLWLALSLTIFPARAVAQTTTAEKQAASEPSISVLRQDADTGNLEAQYKLALLYLDAAGVARDDVQGLQWLRRAAGAGHALSQVTLGLIYRSGSHGVTQDSKEAINWLRKATEAGNPHGQSELGFMYERGEGVPKDEAEAARLYALAAEQGLSIAQFDLGYMYEEGKGVPASPEQAIKLYEKAALYVPTARTNLSVLYSGGKSVPRDSVKAYMWGLLSVSAEFNRILSEKPQTPESRLGHALILLEGISKGMSKKAKKTGRTLATEWINSHANQLGEEPRYFPMATSGLK